MEKRTIAQAVIEVLQASKQPLSTAEITQVIIQSYFLELFVS